MEPDQIFDVVLFIETIPPWIILTIGLSLILIDLFITADSFLMLIGLSFMVVGVLNYYDFSGHTQIVAFPIILIFNLVFVRKFFLKMSFNKKEMIGVDNVLGKSGNVILVNEEIKSYGRAFIPGHGEWNIRTKSDQNIYINDGIKVIERDGITLVVELE